MQGLHVRCTQIHEMARATSDLLHSQQSSKSRHNAISTVLEFPMSLPLLAEGIPTADSAS